MNPFDPNATMFTMIYHSHTGTSMEVKITPNSCGHQIESFLELAGAFQALTEQLHETSLMIKEGELDQTETACIIHTLSHAMLETKEEILARTPIYRQNPGAVRTMLRGESNLYLREKIVSVFKEVECQLQLNLSEQKTLSNLDELRRRQQSGEKLTLDQLFEALGLKEAPPAGSSPPVAKKH